MILTESLAFEEWNISRTQFTANSVVYISSFSLDILLHIHGGWSHGIFTSKTVVICWDVWKNALSCCCQIWSWCLLTRFPFSWRETKVAQTEKLCCARTRKELGCYKICYLSCNEFYGINIFFLCLLSVNCRCCTGYNRSEFHVWDAIDIEF